MQGTSSACISHPGTPHFCAALTCKLATALKCSCVLWAWVSSSLSIDTQVEANIKLKAELDYKGHHAQVPKPHFFGPISCVMQVEAKIKVKAELDDKGTVVKLSVERKVEEGDVEESRQVEVKLPK